MVYVIGTHKLYGLCASYVLKYDTVQERHQFLVTLPSYVRLLSYVTVGKEN